MGAIGMSRMLMHLSKRGDTEQMAKIINRTAVRRCASRPMYSRVPGSFEPPSGRNSISSGASLRSAELAAPVIDRN